MVDIGLNTPHKNAPLQEWGVNVRYVLAALRVGILRGRIARGHNPPGTRHPASLAVRGR